MTDGHRVAAFPADELDDHPAVTPPSTPPVPVQHPAAKA